MCSCTCLRLPEVQPDMRRYAHVAGDMNDLTTRIAAMLERMRSHGQHEYAEAARIWYWELLGPYLK